MSIAPPVAAPPAAPAVTRSRRRQTEGEPGALREEIRFEQLERGGDAPRSSGARRCAAPRVDARPRGARASSGTRRSSVGRRSLRPILVGTDRRSTTSASASVDQLRDLARRRVAPAARDRVEGRDGRLDRLAPAGLELAEGQQQLAPGRRIRLQRVDHAHDPKELPERGLPLRRRGARLAIGLMTAMLGRPVQRRISISASYSGP